MASQKQSFEVIEFKTQQEINADRRKKIDNERKALRRRIDGIRKKGNKNPRKKSLV